jgi:hypothetical protein
VRAEEKVVDGPELERDEGKESLEHEDVEELPVLVDEQVVDRELEHRDQVLAATRAILARGTLVIDTLQLPKRELIALEFLKAAVDGRDRALAKWIYAEDRRDMLEQALAVLEPILEHGDATMVGDLDDVRVQVGELRSRLSNLEDAQDELLVEDDGEVKAETESTDKPEGDASLDGPERPAEPKKPTTLGGPARPDEPAKPTTLVGPEIRESPKSSTLGGLALPDEPAKSTTLTGPALPDEAAKPTTLGDAADIEKAQATPWWRRMFG